MANTPRDFVARKGISSLGGVTFPLRQVSSTTNVTVDDYTIEATSGTFTVTLPSPVGITGKIFVIKNAGAGIVTVDTAAGNIDGQTAQTLSQYATIQVQSTGSDYIIAGVDGSSGSS